MYCYTHPPAPQFLEKLSPFILSDRLSFQSVAQINFNLTFLRAYAPSQSRGRTKEIKWSLKILNKQNKKVTLFPQAIQLP